MRRRRFLRNAAAVPLLSLLPRSLLARSAAGGLTLRRVRPSDPAWPNQASWQELNGSVGGNLIKVQSLFAACEAQPQGAACLDAAKNIRNPFYIGDQPAGTEVSGWLDAWIPEPSAYAIAARNTADVVAGVNFARRNKLRLVVKGGGHSYQGTSNAADSLLIWTRRMNKVTLHERFVAKGCERKSAPAPAVTAEAGAMWIDLYNAVTTEGGRYVQGGGCTTVGVAGLIQSGGFGSFSKGFGTAASGLLEAEIVTTDGSVLTVNPCTHPDLFWAIQGGGGGNWGVVTRVTLRTHDLPEFFGAAWGKIKAQSDDAFRKLIGRFIGFYAENLFNPHWGEQVSVGEDNTLKISMVCQALDKQQLKQVWQPFFDWVAASPNDFSVADKLGAGASAARDWWAVEGNGSMIRDTREGAPKYHGWWQGDQDQVGAFLHGYDSLWLPSSLLQPERLSRLTEALFDASRHKGVGLHFNKGLAGATPDAIARARQTATNPTVVDAFALAIIAGGERPSYPGLARPPMDLDAARKGAHEIDSATAELRKIAPDAGSYVSESNYFNRAWQTAYWGGNYPKLRAVKKKYDPDGLFFVHNGVGSEEWSADGFTRVAQR
ncbi:MAG TPA: FAD-binding oxidoreductase [Casimicrobiaceae bacterium]|nr:FAD-binding oxidoreductase [Casimicrobiaceae bacterium]